MKRHFTSLASVSIKNNASNKTKQQQRRDDDDDDDDSDDDVFHAMMSEASSNNSNKPQQTTTPTKKPVIIVHQPSTPVITQSTPPPQSSTTTLTTTAVPYHSRSPTTITQQPPRLINHQQQHKAHMINNNNNRNKRTREISHNDMHKNDEEDNDNDDDNEDDFEKLRNEKRFKRSLDLLKPIDHSTVCYPPFKRNFHQPLSTVSRRSNLGELTLEELREKFEICVSLVNNHGSSHSDRLSSPPMIPDPITQFKYMLGLDRLLVEYIVEQEGFERPTPIQMQAIPCILSGQDLIGIAKTGSGKTGAYVWPMLTHVMYHRLQQQSPSSSSSSSNSNSRSNKSSGNKSGGNSSSSSHGGPVALVLAPTRELALQIHSQIKRYCHGIHCTLRVVPIVGGESKTEQFQWLKKGVADIVVATPGRLIDLLQLRACTLSRVTFLVMDEADLMLSYGFEPHVRCLIGQVRPDRQFLMFSTTFNSRLERLAHEIMMGQSFIESSSSSSSSPLPQRPVSQQTAPAPAQEQRDERSNDGRQCRETAAYHVRLVIGQMIGAANSDITQSVSVMRSNDPSEKWRWLSQRIGHLMYPSCASSDAPSPDQCMNVLIFVSRKADCDQLATRLNTLGYRTGSIHGDKAQEERADVVSAFRSGVFHVLVATDVAARGLDIPSVKTVVNYDVAKDLDTHTHRIGRTGRAGDRDGIAYTLISPCDVEFAPKLVQSLEQSGQSVPHDLMDLAMRVPTFNLRRQYMDARESQNRNHNNNTKNRPPEATMLSHVGVRRTTGVGYEEQHDNTESRFMSGTSFTTPVRSELQHQFLTGFVRKATTTTTMNDRQEERQGEGREQQRPGVKKFEIIGAKNPKPKALGQQ